MAAQSDDGADRLPPHTAVVVFSIVLAIILVIAAISDRIGLWPPGLGFAECYGFYDKTKGHLVYPSLLSSDDDRGQRCKFVPNSP